MFQHNVRVNWIKIKVLKVDKEAENTIKYKYNYDDEDFMKINMGEQS
jgi:hypothetical protein